MNARRLALIIGAGGLCLGAAPSPKADLLIRGGTIYPGSAAPFVGDIAVAGDRISAVGRNLQVRAARTIDAAGLIVAPGFIDPHTHAGEQLMAGDARTRLVPAFLMQGVTTAIIGNDGRGEPNVDQILGSAKTKPVGLNYAAYVGFGAVRKAVIGEVDRAPNEAELRQMRLQVASAMCGGALGLSSGLFYAPQSYATTGEVVALAREAASRGGRYDSHIRDESSYTIGLAAAIDEAIEIGRRAGLPVNISHIKALGVDVQGQAPAIIKKVEAARASGQKVAADQYPWSASGTSLVAALVPGWAQDGGRTALLKRFDETDGRQRLQVEMFENMRRRGGPAALLITEGDFKGKTLAAIAASRREDPIAAAIAVIRVKDPAVASFNQSEADIAAFMRRPWVMTGSDASPGHPRAFGSFARKYEHYVRGLGVLTLREFVHRSSTLAAETLELKDRGRIQRGAFADIVLFDPAAYAARATYEQPTLLATGVQAVLVNGVLAVDRGKLTGRAAGRPLRHAPLRGSCHPNQR